MRAEQRATHPLSPAATPLLMELCAMLSASSNGPCPALSPACEAAAPAMMPGQIPDPSLTAGALPGLGPLTGLPGTALTAEELKYADIRNIGAMISPLHFLEVKLGKRPQPVKSEVSPKAAIGELVHCFPPISGGHEPLVLHSIFLVFSAHVLTGFSILTAVECLHLPMPANRNPSV